MKTALSIILFILCIQIMYCQDFRASLLCEKLTNETEWSEWKYSGALIRLTKNNTIRLKDDDTYIDYQIIEKSNEYYDGNPNATVFKCKDTNNSIVNIIFVDKMINFMEDKKNKKYKLDRFIFYVESKDKKKQYNVYLLNHGTLN